jgi:hypothetical protein
VGTYGPQRHISSRVRLLSGPTGKLCRLAGRRFARSLPRCAVPVPAPCSLAERRSSALLYGAADLALKAVTGLHGAAAIATSPWLAAGLASSVGAFFAFQRGLQGERPLAVIATMTAATNISSIAGAFVVYADRLGRTPALAAAHALAFVLVLAAAWRLAPAQARLIGVTPPALPRSSAPR